MNSKLSLLPGEFVAGLTEGEGCFALKFRRDVKKDRPNSPAYFGWQALFAISLRKDDAPLLGKVKNALRCGSLSFSDDSIRFQIQDIETLVNKVIPFFDRFRLYGKKYNDFVLWKEAVMIIYRNKKKSVNVKQGRRGFIPVIWNKKDLLRLKGIREEMKLFKSKGHPFKWTG